MLYIYTNAEKCFDIVFGEQRTDGWNEFHPYNI